MDGTSYSNLTLKHSSAVCKISLVELILTFSHIALASWGGGLSAWSREVLVNEKKWMTDEEFLSALGICQILPGANQVNFSIFVGTRFRGWIGGVCALFGLIAAPFMVVLALGFLYFQFRESIVFKNYLHGMAAGAVGMTFSLAIKSGKSCLRGAMPMLLALGMFASSAVFRQPLFIGLLIFAPFAVAWAWWLGSREERKKGEEGKNE